MEGFPGKVSNVKKRFGLVALCMELQNFCPETTPTIVPNVKRDLPVESHAKNYMILLIVPQP
jgi:hypothetical protein